MEGTEERHTRLARWSLAAALLTGACFGLAQQARGAHFLSHDLWSALLTWLTALTLYAYVFRARLWPEHSAACHEEAAQQLAARVGQHAT